MYKTEQLFDLDKSIAKEYLSKYEYPWQVLDDISKIIIEIGNKLDQNEYKKIGDDIWVHKNAKVASSSSIVGPTIICEGAEIRHCAFVRGSALIDKDCVVGNSCEIKNSILLEHAEIPHFNYVGDSILGYKAHMGAGAVTSNLKSDRKNIVVKDEEERIDINRRKMGAMIGDNSEIGCNSVLNPGTIIGKNCIVYPTSCVRGTVKENSIYKNSGVIVVKK